MNDYLLKATANKGEVRIYISKTTEIVKEAMRIHDTSLSATAAIGRLLTVASLMGAMFKNEDELITLSIKGDGVLKGLIATSDYTGNVKGYILNPFGEVPLKENGKIDVSGAIGHGSLEVIQDLGLNKEPYVGKVDLVSGEIAEDLTYYYAQSEQIPTSIALGVSVKKDLSVWEAGGFIVQLMPGATPETVTKLENNIKQLEPITAMLNRGEKPEDILNKILDGFDISINEKIPIKYYCNCSREKVEKVLISLGVKELKSLLEEDKEAIIHCHFCGKDYKFSDDELEEIINNLQS